MKLSIFNAIYTSKLFLLLIKYAISQLSELKTNKILCDSDRK